MFLILFALLSSLLAAKRDKSTGAPGAFLERHILGQPPYCLTVCFLRFRSEPFLPVDFPHHSQLTDISLLSTLRQVSRARNKNYR